jgi:hypothetical protein
MFRGTWNPFANGSLGAITLRLLTLPMFGLEPTFAR